MKHFHFSLNEFSDEMMYKYAKPFAGSVLPEDITRGKLGDCFDCSLIQATRNPKYKYVEGFVYSMKEKDWIHHAWLTDEKEENAYDPTWYAVNGQGKEMPVPYLYLGVVMDTKKLPTL